MQKNNNEKTFEIIKKEFIEKGKRNGQLTQEEIVETFSEHEISAEDI